MLIFNLFIALIIPFVLGMAVISALLRNKLIFFNFWERLALYFSVGWGLHAILMFLLSLGKVPLTFASLLLADAVIIPAGLLFGLRFNFNKFQPVSINFNKFPFSFKLIGSLAMVVIALKILFISWSAFIKPAFEPDIIRSYALGAKVIFEHKTTLMLHRFVGDKPPLPFLYQAWSAMGSREWNDILLPLSHPFMYLSFLIIFYSALRRRFPPFHSLFSTLLWSTIPFLVFQAGTAYTDFPQAFYYSAATFYLFLFMQDFRQRTCLPAGRKEAAGAYLLTSALLLGISVWIKRGSLLEAGINIAVLTVFLIYARRSFEKKDWKTFLTAALLFISIIAPWLTYSQFETLKIFHPGPTHPIATSSLIQPESHEIFQALLRNTFFEDNWHLLGVLFLFVLLLYPGTAFRPPQIFLLGVISLQFVFLFALFRSSAYFYQFILNETLLNRLTFHFIPVVLYYCAEVVGAGELKE
ncbi:hypothetical protein HZB08_01285 [Candidatus Saganbacteria bacterium]|uniref:Uncharacterized protein n=1 Tax=Candidatus Saganbacteria bacterium TaxID=2575572 RepID=A0A9D6UK85_UNCSA|nr:hypothetical protein [Candidatus Saganbacteria bacterium]